MASWRLATPLFILLSAACVLDSSGLLLFEPEDDGGPGGGGFGGGATTVGPSTTATTSATSTTTTSSGMGGATSGTGGAGGGVVGWGYRQKVTVTASSASVFVNYQVFVDVPHAKLVGDGQSLPSGDDIYVVHDDGASLEVLPRAVDPSTSWNEETTRVWFKVQAPIAENGSDDTYWLYYGNPAASPPPSDPADVFIIFDQFDGPLAANWTHAAIGSGATGDATVMDGRLHIGGQTGEIYGTSDSFYFASRGLMTATNVAVRAKVVGSGGSFPGFSILGGTMIRQTTSAESRFILAAPAEGTYLTYQDPDGDEYPANRTNTYRLSTGGDADEEPVLDTAMVTPVVVEATLYGTTGRSRYANDGLAFSPIGPSHTFAAWNPAAYRVGLAFANDGSDNGHAEVDWFLVRSFVDPEPTTALDVVEPGLHTLP